MRRGLKYNWNACYWFRELGEMWLVEQKTRTIPKFLIVTLGNQIRLLSDLRESPFWDKRQDILMHSREKECQECYTYHFLC